MFTDQKNFLSSALRVLLLTAGTSLPLMVQAAGTITIQKLAPFGPDLSVPAEVKLNCDLDTRIPAYVAENARGKSEQIVMSDTLATAAPGQTLTMAIIGLSGKEGGLGSGGKYIILEGSLRENGQVKGSFRAKRKINATGGASYKGTCNLLDRCAKALGKDVAKWLQKPDLNARLGDEL